jgi:hypothetical protein
MVLSISPNPRLSNLDELKDSLNLLTQQQTRREKYGMVAVAILWVILSTVAFLVFGKKIIWVWLVLSYLYLIFAIAYSVDAISKTQLARRIKELKLQISDEEERLRQEKKLREERRKQERKAQIIGIIKALEADGEIRKAEMLRIESAIHNKRKWRTEFDGFLAILERNRPLDEAANREFSQAIVELINIDFSEYRARSHSKVGYVNYRWLDWRFEKMKAWEPPAYAPRGRQATDLYDDEEERSDKARFADESPVTLPAAEPIPIDDWKTSDVVIRPREKVSIPRAGTSERRPPTQTLADEFSLSERSLADMPKQRPSRQVSHRRIKISEELQREINARKVRIGALGELAVMDDERLRLVRDGERNTKPVHVSLTDDGKGYDVQSWKDGQKIFIEVKTTVGDFWSSLYFTENEKATMEEIKEQYFLYRICNFNVETGEGSLFIYAGEKLITNTFEFNSHRYVLSAKNQ